MTRKNDKAAAPKSESKGVTVVWDDSEMRTCYANVTNVQGSREEISLLMGTNRGWKPGQTEVHVQLTDRIVLNPHAARRLSVLLNKVLAEYEARYGSLGGDS